MDLWRLFSEELPSTTEWEQVPVLFGSPKWSTYFRGLYQYRPGELLINCLSEYDQEHDKFFLWNKTVPTHWMLLPENPVNLKEYYAYKSTKTRKELLDNTKAAPFSLTLISQSMGISLNSIESVTWHSLADGQLIDFKINFIPNL